MITSAKMKLIKMPCTSKEVEVFTIDCTLDNDGLISLMNVGWIIISSWIDDVTKIPNQTGVVCVENISFRMALGNKRLIVNANISVSVPTNVVVNIDTNKNNNEPMIVPSTTNEMWLLRMASIAGFGTGSGGGPGSVAAANPVKFSILGLDIEVSTFERKGAMPLPHDPIISITISNGAWHDNTTEDVCYCIYTFGYHREIEFPGGRKVTFLKAGTSEMAVQKVYELLNELSPDFVNVHNGFGFDLHRIATHATNLVGTCNTFESRRLGNSGTAIYWRLKNGVSFVDSMYDIDKYLRKDWPSIGLGKVADILGLPPKLDADEMMIKPSDTYDVTDMLIYNSRDSDLHAWLVKTMNTCERYFMLAGTSRSIIWDAIAGNTGNMMFCYQSSVALSKGACLDLSRNEDADEREFEGGFVLEPKPGCYKGVVVIDGNSLYGSIMGKLGIFINTCASSRTSLGLAHKLGRDIVRVLEDVEVGDVVEYENLILMRSDDSFMCVIKSGPTMLSAIIDELITKRKDAKFSGNEDRAWAYKLLLVSVYGAMGSKHGIISSKTCAEITTYAARFYLKCMIKATRLCGYEVLYGDTDSIFVWTKGENEIACATTGVKVKSSISDMMSKTAFASVGADVKGNYMSIVISAKKKYEAVTWNGELETKGFAMVKKDALPIVRFALSEVMKVLNNTGSNDDKNRDLVALVGKIMLALQNGKLSARSQMTEVKINGQPHYCYVDSNMKKRKILIGIGISPSDVNKRWVAKRIESAINSVLVPMNMYNFSQLLFCYESMRILSPK